MTTKIGVPAVPTNGEEELSHEINQFLSTLPKENRWPLLTLRQFQGCWYSEKGVLGVLPCQQHFQVRHSDLILVSAPKSGTTWLKALAFATVNRSRYPCSDHPLLANSPHDLVGFLELDLFQNNRVSILDSLPNPRILATHMPYSVLPQSVKDSKCKVVFLCRDPRDLIVSHWHFLRNQSPKDQVPISLEELFHLFCSGISPAGPFWDHILGYWNASKERPDKKMFLKYEDLKREPMLQLKTLAGFLGYPFMPNEVTDGVMEDILRLCSFESLSNLQVNKTGKIKLGYERSSFFRKGEVGDWSNYLSQQMIERLDQLMEQKFQGSGLTFQPSSTTRA